MLIGDLYTYQTKSEQSGGSPNCRLCNDSLFEDTCHNLTTCSAYSEIRLRLLQEYSYLCLQSKSEVDFSEFLSENETLCQFIIDPTSFNLKRRISLSDPLIASFFQTSRDLCYTINERRLKLLKEKKQQGVD